MGKCLQTRLWAEQTLTDRPGVRFDASPDSGIYDALNQAVAAVETKYYLVVGSDDMVDAAALVHVSGKLAALGTTRHAPDILSFPVRTTPGGIRRRKRFRPLWVSSSSLVSSHSVGTMIRRDLHDQIGQYDILYRILADSLLLRRAWLSGARFEHHSEPVLGTFNLQGVSSRDHGRRILETYNYMTSTGSPRWLQATLLWLRLLRFRPPTLP